MENLADEKFQVRVTWRTNERGWKVKLTRVSVSTGRCSITREINPRIHAPMAILNIPRACHGAPSPTGTYRQFSNNRDRFQFGNFSGAKKNALKNRVTFPRE